MLLKFQFCFSEAGATSHQLLVFFATCVQQAMSALHVGLISLRAAWLCLMPDWLTELELDALKKNTLPCAQLGRKLPFDQWINLCNDTAESRENESSLQKLQGEKFAHLCRYSSACLAHIHFTRSDSNFDFLPTYVNGEIQVIFCCECFWLFSPWHSIYYYPDNFFVTPFFCPFSKTR